MLNKIKDKILRLNSNNKNLDSTKQDLDVYWDPKMAEALETWGEGNSWNEIQLLLASCKGEVLDIACGTGKVMELLSNHKSIEVHGFDISDFLIGKAKDRGIPEDKLLLLDATKTGIQTDRYDYSYSIGSLEHFTEDGISKFLSECYNYTSKISFHMIPVSAKDKNEGWMKSGQSFHNNSVEWWLGKFHESYESVRVLDSIWSDDISIGKWFICEK